MDSPEWLTEILRHLGNYYVTPHPSAMDAPPVLNDTQAAQLICQRFEAALKEFGEFCHERYLGCGQLNSSPTGFEYSYSREVVTMAEEFLAQRYNQPGQEDK
jgi:hypothetical protein